MQAALYASPAGSLHSFIVPAGDLPVSMDDIVGAAKMMLPPEQAEQSIYFMMLLARAD